MVETGAKARIAKVPLGLSRADGASLGLWLVAGWLLHDLALMASLVSPALVPRMVLPSLLLVVVVTLAAGCLSFRRSFYWMVLGSVAVFGLTTTFFRPEIDPAFIGLSKSLLVLLLAGGTMTLLPGRWRLASLPLGLCLAALMSTARGLWWGTLDARHLIFEALVGGLGLLLFATFTLEASKPRFRLQLTLWLAFGVLTAVNSWSVSQLRRPDLPEAAAPTASNRPNLLLIVLDTVRADRLAWHGYHRSTTPELEKSVREGFTVYSSARSTSSWTLPSHGSLLTGLLPSEHHARQNRAAEDSPLRLGNFQVTLLRDDVETLAEQLAGRGYRTGAIVANSAVLAHEMGLDRGFEHYDDRQTTGLNCRQLLVQQIGWRPELGCLRYRDAQAVTDLALSWLPKKPGKSWFLFVNFMDAHAPYVPPAPYDRAFSNRRPIDPIKPPRELKSLQYDRQLLYLDHHLMRLFEGLKARRQWRDTVVIVTSDHGESFGEHQHWGHNRYLYEVLIHVPLVVKGAGQDDSSTVDSPISGHEVFSLALHELGLGPAPSLRQDLRLVAEWYDSIPRVEAGHRVPTDRLAWLAGNRKIHAGSRGELEVYDLEQDSGESEDLVEEWPEAERVRELSIEHWAAARQTGKSPRLNPELIESLKALGYL